MPSREPALDGAQILQSLPWRWRAQGRIFLIGGLGFMFDAWDVALNGVLIPLVAAEWSLDRPTAALLATSNLIGMAVGAFAWGGIADRIGRKTAFSATLLIFSIFTIAGALAPDFLWFCLFRFIAGFGLGGCIPVDYALVCEFTPKKQRGTVLAALDGWWPLGAAAGFFASGAVLAMTGEWRLILLAMVLPALLVFWVRLGVPESPLYLIRRGQPEQARRIIDRLVQQTGAPVRPYTLAPEAPGVPEAPGPGTHSSPAPLNIAGQLRALWAFNWRITATSWLLSFSILLVYYLALNWMPSILMEAGLGSQTALFANGAMAAVGLVGVLISALLIERTGRKAIIAVTGPLAAALLAVTAWSLGTPMLAVLWLLGFGLVVQAAIPALYTYLAELYPTELRATGFGWASTVSRVGAGLGPLFFASVLWPLLGLPVSFLLSGVLVLFAVLWMLRFAPETRGRQLN
ncbi:MFS transporter [Acaricomes phytoseiuli]|uniref:MFS transporter n=1 Tax=Acaricomes phytoseiuli TaxID=291968 RepID=UPI000376D5F6|nr:MFS transporter [Acaricomes phytoseiuli]MCW1248949.1 MFS transporter [Acaricomes phytoseiuli]